MSGTIGFNAMALRPGGSGVQTYIRELLRALSTAPSFTREARVRVQADAVAEVPTGMHTDVRPTSDGVRRAWHGHAPFPGVDLVHGLDVDLPLQAGTASVATVHDLAVFDAPWAFGRGRAVAEQQLLRLTARRADALIAVSDYTAERLAARLGRTAVVIPLAASPDMVPPSPDDVAALRERMRLPERFLLQVGTVEPRKDVATLAAAAARTGCPVVLAGKVTGPVPRGVRSLGYVDRTDLPLLYAAATIVTYISLYEGFGLPPLEAMACGAPVVATKVGALPHVVGDGCVLVPPGDIAALAAELEVLLGDEQARVALSARGLARAAEQSWARAAEQTAAVYDLVLGR